MALFDAFPGEKLAMRICDTLEKAGIGLLRPGQLRREGRAKAEVEYLMRMAIAQAERDAADLAAGRSQLDLKSGKVLPRFPTIPALAAPAGSPSMTSQAQPDDLSAAVPRLGSAFGPTNSALQSLALRETRQAINIENIIEKARAEASDVSDGQVSDKGVHPDWVARWHENAKDVSDEDVQRLWARALAGEVQSPGKYSLRTLDFLRSVSKQEAALIETIGPLSFDAFIFKHDETMARLNIHYGALTELQSLGVLAGVEGLGVHWNIGPPPKSEDATGFICNGLGMVVREATKQIQVPCYTISILGRELLKLGTFAPDRDYVVALAKFIAQHGAKVSLGNTIPREGGFVLLPPIEAFDPPPPPAPPDPPGNAATNEEG